MEKREPSYTAGWNVNWCSHCGKHYGGLFKKIIELSYDPEITFMGMHTHTRIYMMKIPVFIAALFTILKI